MEKTISELRTIYEQKINAKSKNQVDIIINLTNKQSKKLKKIISSEKFMEHLYVQIRSKIYKFDTSTYNMDIGVFNQIMKERDVLENIDHLLEGSLSKLKVCLNSMAQIYKAEMELIKSKNYSALDELLGRENTQYEEINSQLTNINSSMNESLIGSYLKDMNSLSYNKRTIRAGQIITKTIRNMLVRISIEGEEIPKTGPCILAPRHFNAFIDPLIVINCFPRKVFIMTAVDFYLMVPFLKGFLKGMISKIGGQFVKRVDEDYAKLGMNRSKQAVKAELVQGEQVSNLTAIRNLLTHLKYGDAVLIFPEGDQKINSSYTRPKGEEVIIPHPGFAMLAIMAFKKGQNVPIYPIGLIYSRGFLGLGHSLVGATSFVRMRVGKPFFVSEFVSLGETDKIQEALVNKMYHELIDLSK